MRKKKEDQQAIPTAINDEAEVISKAEQEEAEIKGKLQKKRTVRTLMIIFLVMRKLGCQQRGSPM